MDRKTLYFWTNYIIKVMLFLFMMVLPVSLDASNLFLGTGIFVFFSTYPFTRKFYGRPDKKSWKLLLCSSFVIYFLVVLSLFYSVEPNETVKFLSYRISLGLIPLMFFLGFRITRREFEAISSGIIPGVFIVIFYYFLLGVYGLANGHITLGQFTFSTLENNNVPFLIHRTYLAFYAFYSLIIVLFSKFIRYRFWFKITFAFFVIAALLSSESRIMVSVLFLFGILYPFLISKGKRLVKLMAVIYGVILLSLLLPVLSGSYEKIVERFYTVAEEISVDAVTDEVGYDSRASRWKLALGLISRKPLTGYGAGTEKAVLLETYQENSLVWSSLFKVDTHNQYLSFCIENGIFAGLFYIFLLITVFLKSLSKRNYISLFFISLCAVMSMVENILNVNYMITIFAFVTSAALFTEPNKRGRT